MTRLLWHDNVIGDTGKHPKERNTSHAYRKKK